MPELPEVETIKLQLQKLLKGHRVVSVEVKNRKIFEGNEKDLIGGRVKEVRRFGKVVVIDFDNGFSLLTHLKLTGQLIYQGPNLSSKGQLSEKVIGGVPGPHTHVIFSLDREGVLYYNDIRRFGWIKIVKSEKLKIESEFLRKLGPEPFKDLTIDLFKNILSKSSRPIKIILMDQEKIAGLGNIYANEALWLAGINPTKESKKLRTEEQEKLYKAIHTVLKAGIKYGGTSDQAYVTPEGKEGEYQKHTLVYGRNGEVCGCCKKNKINKFFLGGRGTYWCPVCQK